jgi:hypothetical protein
MNSFFNINSNTPPPPQILYPVLKLWTFKFTKETLFLMYLFMFDTLDVDESEKKTYYQLDLELTQC